MYTKSLYVYLQMMPNLPKQYPDVYNKLIEAPLCREAVRSTLGRALTWFSYCLNEQALMGSLKTTEGFIQGREMIEA